LKIEIKGQVVNFKKFEGSNYNFWKSWKFIGLKLENLRTKMQNLKNY